MDADAASGSFLRRMQNGAHGGWGRVRSFWDGLKLAKASVISVTLGLLMFYAVPQVQDLFLEVRGSAWMNAVFWTAFHLAILFGWAIPVYVSSRWVLTRFQRDPQARAEAGVVFVEDWVRHTIPPLLATLCFAAVLTGQIMSLGSAPTGEDLFKWLYELQRQCSDNTIPCRALKYVVSVGEVLAVRVADLVGQEKFLFVAYAAGAAIVAWLLLLRALRPKPMHGWRRSARAAWWIITVVVALPVAVLAFSVVFALVQVEGTQRLNLAHLIVLPFATVLSGLLVWWGLRPGGGQQATRVAQLLMRISGKGHSADQATATARLLGPVFYSLLGVALASVVLMLTLHPVYVTGHIYRAIMLPFLLGLMVPVFTYLTYWSARWRAPVVFTIIVVVAVFAAYFADTHDVRIARSKQLTRPTLEGSVRRWAAANDCEIKKDDRGKHTAPGCPAPIIVSAAGGASRAAFLVGGLLGKLLDEKSVPVGHGRPVSSVMFSPDGRHILTLAADPRLRVGDAADHSLRLWDAASGEEVAAFVGHTAIVTSAKFSPDGRRLLTKANDWSARLWDVQSGRQLALLQLQGEMTNSAEFSPDGKRVVISLSSPRAQVWDAETGNPIVTLKGHEATVNSASYSPDGKRVVTASQMDGTARLWDAESGKPVGDPLRVPAKDVDTAVFSSDGKRILTAGRNMAHLWDAQTGNLLATIDGAQYAAFSPDNRRIVTAIFGEDSVGLRDGETGKLIATLAADGSQFNKIAFSFDGRRLAMPLFRAEGWRIWDAENGKEIADLSEADGVAFSPDSRRFATGGKTAQLWDADTGKPIAALKSVRNLGSIGFSPGDQIVTIAANEVRLWDGTTGASIKSFKVLASEKEVAKRPVRPFGKQLFAISAVSGGALSAVTTYAALADSQSKDRASNGVGNPPCLQDYSDSLWFAPHALDPRNSTASIWKPYESWKSCLQLILAGDFLSPVFVSLVSDDLLQINRRGDRAAALEQAWEMRYAQMTGQDKRSASLPGQDQKDLQSKTTLADDMGSVRRRVLEADAKNWLPVLLLNGTSVTTGRRIVSSDVKTQRKDDAGSLKIIRVFNDTYDLQELIEVGNKQQGMSIFEGDIPLSTGATMSARFPIISPHGNIRSRHNRQIVDRVVDGGYYENFGAITSLELARALRDYGLKPFIIVVNNEPQLSGMDCVTADSRLPPPKVQQTATFSTLSSPLNALLGTGGARATLAAVQLCSEIGSENFAYITVQPDKRNPKKAISMSWWLSMHVQKYLDDQLDAEGVNKAAFVKIRSVR